jgi:hypothetical protein
MIATSSNIRWPGGKWTVVAVVAAGLLLLAGANAHLLYVAISSQPDCVDHVKPGETSRGGTFSAAKSSCSGARR